MCVHVSCGHAPVNAHNVNKWCVGCRVRVEMASPHSIVRHVNEDACRANGSGHCVQ